MSSDNSYEVISAYEINEKELIDYYSIIYGQRIRSLKNNWKWQNRSVYYDNSAPFVICDKEGKVIAHLGMMPFKMLLNGNIYDAQWLIDFSVCPDYRRKGLGHIITKKWMEFSDIHLTCCNYRAIKIFKDLGWHQSPFSFFQVIFIRPFSHKKLSRYFPSSFKHGLNRLSKSLLSILYNKYSYPLKNVVIRKLNDINLLEFLNSNRVGNHIGSTFRDLSFLKWRLLESADSYLYRIFESQDSELKFIIKLNDVGGVSHIDILLLTEPSYNENIIKLISTLAIWGKENGYDYIQYYTTRFKRAELIKRKLLAPISYQIYAFHSYDKKIFTDLKKADYYFDYIDSDFEKYQEV